MIALVLLASHLVGDFIFQTRWQSAHKFDDWRYRWRHVTTYTLAFIPALAIFWPGELRGFIFLIGLWTLHYLTDSRRFHSTIGDWVGWNLDEKTNENPLPANAWTPLPILIDQSLHVCQLALLGWLLVA